MSMPLLAATDPAYHVFPGELLPVNRRTFVAQ